VESHHIRLSIYPVDDLPVYIDGADEVTSAAR
jgi:ribose 5-phosphate isomerase